VSVGQESTVPHFEMRHRMRLALEYAQVSVGEMSRILGVDRATTSRYLNGKTTRPVPRSVLVTWALRCGVPLSWLLTGEEPDPDDPASSTIWYPIADTQVLQVVA
jgi:transcriptional regulator with XRE-family HTH domain